MKIVRDTEDQLILANTPWLLSLGLVAFTLVFVGVSLMRLGENQWQGLLMVVGSLAFGGVFLVAFVRKTQLILDRTSNTVVLRRRGLLGYSEDVYDLDDLARAITQTSRSGEGTTTRRAALTFRSGPHKGTHPVTIVYTSGRGPARAVDAINAWLGRDASR